MQTNAEPRLPDQGKGDPPPPPVLPDPRWRVGRCLGQGSSSSVWLVEDSGAGKRYALKVPSGQDPEADGFELRRELAILSRYQHENLLGVEGILATVRGFGLLLEYVPGDSLARLVAVRGTLSAGETVTVLVAVGRALGCLHADGAVHGDVSPGNVLFTANGKPLLADFGTGRLLAEPGGPRTGTPGFTASDPAGPAGDSGAGQAGDVFALGALGWFMLTGRPLVPGLRPPLSVLLPELPAVLRDLVDSALEEDPRLRPEAADFAARVLRACPAEPVDLLPAVHSSVRPELRTRRTSGSPGPVGTRRPRLRARRRSRKAPWEEVRKRGRGPGPLSGWLIAATLMVSVTAVLGAVAVLAPQLLRPEAGSGTAPTGQATGSVSADTAGDAPSPPAPETPPAEAPPAEAPVATAGGEPPEPPELAVLTGDDPVAAAEVLTVIRARAFAQGNPRLLDWVNLPGSPAEAADLEQVLALQERSERLEGLSVAVLETSAAGGSGQRTRVSVSAELSGWMQVHRDGTQAAAPGGPMRQEVLLELARTGEQWRIAAVLPAAASLQ